MKLRLRSIVKSGFATVTAARFPASPAASDSIELQACYPNSSNVMLHVVKSIDAAQLLLLMFCHSAFTVDLFFQV